MSDLGDKVLAQAAVEVVKVLGRAAKDWWQDHQERRRERLDSFGNRVGNILNIGRVIPEIVPDKLAVPILQAAASHRVNKTLKDAQDLGCTTLRCSAPQNPAILRSQIAWAPLNLSYLFTNARSLPHITIITRRPAQSPAHAPLLAPVRRRS